MIIAIDGPAGSGKSTIAKLLAKKMNLVYIDSGAAYRAVSYYALKNSISLDNDDALCDILENIHLSYNVKGEIQLNNQKLIEEIRTPEVTALVSKVASLNSVRKYITDYLREFSKTNSLVMDGRDIGTIVFPSANFKFYFSADPEIRAKRRLTDLNKELNIENIQQMKELILERDYLDSTRLIAPLQRAEDSILVETGDLSIDELVEHIYKIVIKENANV